MAKSQFFPYRRSIRLPDYDYSQPGQYFITICAFKMHSIFGQIRNGEMNLNPLGRIVSDEWVKTSILRNSVELGPFVVMPNHFNAIIHLLPQELWTSSAKTNLQKDPSITGTFFYPGTGTARRARTEGEDSDNQPIEEVFGKPVPGSIPTIVRSFKSAVTKQINTYRSSPGEVVWHRNYYEHIIRSEKDYAAIEGYILDNPLNWNKDQFWKDQN